MPTILKFKTTEFEKAAEILQRARTEVIKVSDLTCLSELVNNSIVGTSKLLHFVNPELYAIWDSRVARYFFGRPCWQYQVDDLATYRSYLGAVAGAVASPLFGPVHTSMCSKVRYPVTKVRAAELVMFMTRGDAGDADCEDAAGIAPP